MSRETKIIGDTALLRKLRDHPRSASTRVLRKATRAGLAVLLKAVKASTPKDKGVLRKMHTQKVSARGLSSFGAVGADVGKLRSQGTDPLDPRPSNIDWLVEEGHVAPDGTFVRPTGFMSRTEREAAPAAMKAFTDKLTAEIERELSKR